MCPFHLFHEHSIDMGTGKNSLFLSFVFWMILKIEMNAVFLYINGRSRRVFRLAYVQINIGVLWVPFKLFTSRGRQYVQ